MGSVEKPAGEETSGRRFLQWVVRHIGKHYGRGLQPVDLTGVIRGDTPLKRAVFMGRGECQTHGLSTSYGNNGVISSRVSLPFLRPLSARLGPRDMWSYFLWLCVAFSLNLTWKQQISHSTRFSGRPMDLGC
jgi:hypothetical protein